MKKSISILFSLAILILQSQSRVSGQAAIRLFFDRNTYISGETIHLSAVDIKEPPVADKVLYVELISPGGQRITGGKYIFDGGKANGCLKIPKDLVSGYYYARAYTKTMRNLGPRYYDYIPVTVFNPVKTELVLSESGKENLIIDSTRSELFVLGNLQQAYKCREKITVRLKSTAPSTESLKGLCISVVPAGSFSGYRIEMNRENSVEPQEYKYYPEDQGLTITGELVDKDQNVPIEDKVVTMSVVGDKDFSGYKTDRYGKFYFRLPQEYGSRDIFLSTVEGSFQGTQLLIDNDYCTLPVNLPARRFQPSLQEKKLALSMANNVALATTFKTKKTEQKADTIGKAQNSFYSEPTDILRMSDYVQLPTLEEYFYELPLEVKIHKSRAGSTFRFHQPGGNMLVNEPLILVDWVVINNPNKILTIQPQKIDRIETVNRPYVKGNLTYGGIISIISKDGDFAGIDLPSTGIFINYDFYKPACDSCCWFSGERNLPDARNTLLWQPEVNMERGEHTLEFDTPDTPGTYDILIQGVYPDGRPYIQTIPFMVK